MGERQHWGTEAIISAPIRETGSMLVAEINPNSSSKLVYKRNKDTAYVFCALSTGGTRRAEVAPLAGTTASPADGSGLAGKRWGVGCHPAPPLGLLDERSSDKR
jgi:hypothetical protein